MCGVTNIKVTLSGTLTSASNRVELLLSHSALPGVSVRLIGDGVDGNAGGFGGSATSLDLVFWDDGADQATLTGTPNSIQGNFRPISGNLSSFALVNGTGVWQLRVNQFGAADWDWSVSADTMQCDTPKGTLDRRGLHHL